MVLACPRVGVCPRPQCARVVFVLLLVLVSSHRARVVLTLVLVSSHRARVVLTLVMVSSASS
jgi:hypothetical protein